MLTIIISSQNYFNREDTMGNTWNAYFSNFKIIKLILVFLEAFWKTWLISHVTFDYRALETMKEIQKQKNAGESKIQGASVGRRRKSKRCIHFQKIEADIVNCKVIFLRPDLLCSCSLNIPDWNLFLLYLRLCVTIVSRGGPLLTMVWGGPPLLTMV